MSFDVISVLKSSIFIVLDVVGHLAWLILSDRSQHANLTLADWNCHCELMLALILAVYRKKTAKFVSLKSKVTLRSNSLDLL